MFIPVCLYESTLFKTNSFSVKQQAKIDTSWNVGQNCRNNDSAFLIFFLLIPLSFLPYTDYIVTYASEGLCYER